MNFYTNCFKVGNNLLYRGVENGERVMYKVPYKPTLFIPSKNESKFKTIEGRNVEPISFDSIKDASEFVEKYSDVSNFEIFGNYNYQYCHISDCFRNPIEYDVNQIVVAVLDIEVGSESGFPEPETAQEPVTAITIKVKDQFYVFGCGDFTTKEKDIKYFKTKTEEELLRKFLDHWDQIRPDIITGWYILFFDIPYLVNRITKVLGEEEANKLSPWRMIKTRQINSKVINQSVVDLGGVTTLDYWELYRRFAPGGKPESEKLNYIAYLELGEKKISYDEYGSLHNLYKKDFQKFIEYNIKDVDLVDKLERKMKLIEMSIALAFDAKVNFVDVFTQVRMWDTIVFNEFRKEHLVLPQKKRSAKDEQYAGAYVKDPAPGLYNWIVSFDFDSLYPNLISMFNISTETLIPAAFQYVKVDDLLDQKFDTSFIREKNFSLAANGHCFTNDRLGFFPRILMRMYEDRKLYKKKMMEAKREIERVNEELSRRGLR